MTKEQYESKRKELLDKAQAALDNDDIELFNTTKGDIDKLDDDYKKYAEAQANLAALNGTNAQLVGSAAGNFANGDTHNMSGKNGDDAITASSDIYKTAWLKNLRDEQLTAEEREAYSLVNAEGAHTTKTNADVIPTTLADRILRKAEDMFPIWGDTVKYHVRGSFTVVLDTETGDADWYTEDEEGKSETIDTNSTVKLSGNELAKYLEITWKARAMSIPDFETFLIEKLGYKMGRALSRAVAHGKGSEEAKPQPMGIVTYLESKGQSQVTEYTENALSYKDITGARSKISSGYGAGLVIYANANTIWNEIANVMDTNNRPIFMSDTINSGGVGRILGITVKEDASFEDGEILFANMANGYIVNIEEDLAIRSEDTIKGRKIIYGAYMIVDGNVAFAKAFSLLKKNA